MALVTIYRYGRIDTSSTDAIPQAWTPGSSESNQRRSCHRPTSKHRLVNLYYTSYHNKSFAGYNEPVKSVYYINNAYPVACSPRPRDL